MASRRSMVHLSSTRLTRSQRQESANNLSDSDDNNCTHRSNFKRESASKARKNIQIQMDNEASPPESKNSRKSRLISNDKNIASLENDPSATNQIRNVEDDVFSEDGDLDVQMTPRKSPKRTRNQSRVDYTETPSKKLSQSLGRLNMRDEIENTPHRSKSVMTRRSCKEETPKKLLRSFQNLNMKSPTKRRALECPSPTLDIHSEDEFIETSPQISPKKTRSTTNQISTKTPLKNRIEQNRLSIIKKDTPKKNSTPAHLTPSMKQRTCNILKPSTPLQLARVRLHVSAVPKSLPCRDDEFNTIFTFLHGRLSDGTGGCMYISGVPGTGKTATVNEAIKCLHKCVSDKKLSPFTFVDINGMRLSEPRQAYVQINKQLSGETTSWEEAQNLLHKRFTSKKSPTHMTLLLVDELDMLCNKKQDVIYNLLDWPSKANAKLLIVTIANTMDLPERSLKGRVTSRLGLTRETFRPYTFKQLEEIVLSRLKGQSTFQGDAVQFVARKVAAVSGDARRALDICRRATEIAESHDEQIVTMQHVAEAVNEMIANIKVQAIKHCSLMEQYFLKAIVNEINRTGVEEVIFKRVYLQLTELTTFDREPQPSVSDALAICSRLSSWRLIICDHSRMDLHQRILLNVSPDDIHFATVEIN